MIELLKKRILAPSKNGWKVYDKSCVNQAYKEIQKDYDE